MQDNCFFLFSFRHFSSQSRLSLNRVLAMNFNSNKRKQCDLKQERPHFEKIVPFALCEVTRFHKKQGEFSNRIKPAPGFNVKPNIKTFNVGGRLQVLRITRFLKSRFMFPQPSTARR